MTYTTASFDTGSEFRVDWMTQIPNPRYNPAIARAMKMRYTITQEITTSHKSEIFPTYEAAEAFGGPRAWIMVRRPGNKGFRPARQTKKV